MRGHQEQQFALWPAVIAAVVYLVLVNLHGWINSDRPKPSGIVYPIHAGP